MDKPSYIVIGEGIVLLAWLIGGLYLFTNFVEFQSVHFGGTVRTLTLVEAVYLFAQIITTVGYGDITPKYFSGQLVVGTIVFCSILLIAAMVSELSAMIMERAEKRLGQQVESGEEPKQK